MHEKIIASSSIIVDLFYFFQVVVNPWPVTRTWVPAVSVPPAGHPLTRGVRRRRLMGPRIWWCFPVTAVAPFEIIWDARPCYPSGCAVSGKEGARPWREKNSLRKKSSCSKMEGCFAVQCAISFQSVDRTKQFSFPLWTSADIQWDRRNVSETLNELWMRDVNDQECYSKGRCACRKSSRDFSTRRVRRTDAILFVLSPRDLSERVTRILPFLRSLVPSVNLFANTFYLFLLLRGPRRFLLYVRNFFTGSPMGGIKVTFVNFTSRILR